MEKTIKDWIQIKITPGNNNKKVIELIKQLYKTHNVVFTENGTIYINKK
jgi:hypothetical protein